MNIIGDIIIILFPIISGFSIGNYCGIKETSGESVSFRPPPWVFALVWPILYLLIGLSLFFSLKLYKETLIASKFFIILSYIFLNILLCLWIYLYSCKNMKKEAIYSIILSLLFAIICYVISGNIISQIMLAPLIIWLFFEKRPLFLIK